MAHRASVQKKELSKVKASEVVHPALHPGVRLTTTFADVLFNTSLRRLSDNRGYVPGTAYNRSLSVRTPRTSITRGMHCTSLYCTVLH